jgi:ATP-dependent DNA ligase
VPDVAPPRGSRFGSPLVLSRVHWVRPQLVAEVKFLAWTEDSLLRQVVYEGLREDKPAGEVRREVPHTKSGKTKLRLRRYNWMSPARVP